MPKFDSIPQPKRNEVGQGSVEKLKRAQRAEAQKPKVKEGRLTFSISEVTARRFKTACAHLGITQAAKLEELIDGWLAEAKAEGLLNYD